MKRIQGDRIADKQKNLHLALKSLLVIGYIGLAIYGIFYGWSILATRAQPETFTELYFEDHLHLPSRVIPKHQYSFQFTLHNLEDNDMEYSYEVYADVGPGRLFLIFDKGSFFVKKNQYKTIQESFAITSSFPRSEIIVNIINKNQKIDFWIERVK